ncbi:DUF4124 domain-containing protein [Pseudomonas sp. HMWF032]|uniref:DUF4124 domain-containing protein n=1 Tax=unclassified Pseudomonas TaxID=196821 RepID=UPI000D398EA5|nr:MULTISPECIES: DUF4124 domain-containing protein [unclassified Pseudomonas]PTS83107.1 DUF4124 domain-containing protein [Pseudomonas sp. HMWF032]PTT81496.1 DUF4124 domain-containing protein [Pseudomonas sp. HMWF010]WAC45158.1 DUF4124 domain-containing protein [Pseudomonas sp. SL4(2022)]
MRILLSLMLLPGLAMAEIYRWTDANGQVHFSQRPAPGAQQVEVKPQVVERDQLTREREERTSRFFDARRDEQAQASAEAAERQSKRAAECQDLRSRLGNIPEGFSYYRTAANGEREYYSDQQIDTARQQLQRQIAERCS